MTAIPYTATFDGHPLDGMPYVVDYIERPLMPEATVTTTQVSGRDGAAFGSVTYGQASVKVGVHFEASSPEKLTAMRAQLASWLHVDSPKRLTLSDEPGTYRLAVPTGSTEVEEWACGLSVVLGFVCPDPLRYEEERSAMTDGGFARLSIGGTVPVHPVIDLTQCIGTLRIMSDEGDVFLADIGDTSSDVVVDCERRIVTKAGARIAPSLSSDWLVLSPGPRKITITSGTIFAAKISWRPAWL